MGPEGYSIHKQRNCAGTCVYLYVHRYTMYNALIVYCSVPADGSYGY